MSRGVDRVVALLGIALAFGFAGVAIGSRIDDDDPARTSETAGSTASTASPTSTTTKVEALDQVSLAGRALLDGEPLDAEFLGAVVLDDSLVTPCNVTIPPVEDGRFSIDVYAAEASAGCGRPGAQIVLWTFVDDQKVFAALPIDWPVEAAADLEVGFSSTQASGAAPAVFEMNGVVQRADGSRVEQGARVEAFIGDTLCGVASVRGGEFEGFVMHVVGPGSIPGCEGDANITFRVDGVDASETLRNGGEPPQDFTLTLP